MARAGPLDRRGRRLPRRSVAPALPAGSAPALLARDKDGRPVLLDYDLRGETLLVRAFRSYRAGPAAVLLASLDGERATLRSIGCFGPGSLNRGLGTALLRLAEDVMARHGVTRVTGSLAPADLDHRDRQVHFYLKNGYEVRLRGLSGTVTKTLPNPRREPGV